MSLQPGDVLLNGQYRIVRQVGRGGFGFVYLAEDALLHHAVAIKELLPTLIGDDAMLKRFLAEARATLQLTHERIVRTYNLFSERDNYYIAMEYMAGGSLEARLGEHDALPVEEAVRVAADVAEGLAYAHGHKVVHCDLKPANILFTADGRAKVADFGIAHVSDQMLSRSWMTSAGFVAGTLPYMSPEQMEGVRDDPRVDIYALGAVLYRMVTGRPYLDFEQGETPAAQIRNGRRIQEEAPMPPSRQRGRVPAWLDAVVLKALAKRPEERHASAGEMREALLQPAYAAPSTRPREAQTMVVSPRPERLPAAARPRPGARPQPRPRPKWLWPAIGGAAVLLGVVAVALIVLGGGGREGPAAAQATAISPSLKPPEATSAPARITVAPPPTAREATAAPLPPSPTPLRWSGEIKIAILAPLSGDLSAYGVTTRDGALLAVEEWNAKGGVLGKQIVPIIEDSLCLAGPAADAANKVIDQDQVRYIIGDVCSPSSILISEIANARGVLQISPSATNAAVTVKEGKTRDYTFRACFIDSFQGQVAARFAIDDLKAKTAFVMLNQANAYAKGLAEVFSREFAAAGGAVAGTGRYTGQEADFSTLLDEVARLGPDVVYLPDYYDIVNPVTREAKDRGITALFMGGDGWDSPDLDLNAAAGGFFTSHYATGSTAPAAIAFRDAFAAKYNGDAGSAPDALAALAYDAANLLLQSIQNAGVDDAARVKDAMARISFEGATGKISFDAQHNPVKSAAILRVTEEGVIFHSIVNP